MKLAVLIKLLSLLFVCGLNAQSFNEIDSLVKKTRSNLRDPYLTVTLADSLISLSEAADYPFGLASGMKFKGIGLHYSGRIDSAKIFYERSLQLFTELNDTLEIAKAHLNIATYYNAKANYTASIDNSLRALEGFRQVEDINGVGRVLNLIGQSYYFQEDYEGALSYFKQYLGNALLAGDSVEISSARTNTGAAFEMMGQYDSALYYLENAIALKERLNFLGNIGTSYYNAGDLYVDLEQYDKAQGYFEKALNFYQNVNDSMRMAELYHQLAFMDYQLENLRSAERQSQVALEMAEAVGANEVKKSAFELLAKIYDGLNRPRDAYQALWRHVEVKDSILNSENIQSINALREEFQAKEKEQQIALQELTLGQQEARIQRNQLIILVLCLVVALVLLFYFVRRNQERRKRELIKRDSELKMREAELNAVINSQEKERDRFARDLHDGFGQMISVLKLNLSRLNEISGRDNETRQEVYENGKSVIDEMYGELRNICFDLMPQTLIKHGLSPALNEFSDRINQTGKVACEVMVFGDGKRFSEKLEISLFRITQEWVNNVLKYGDANHLTIQLTQEAAEATLTIEDNGKGFDESLFYQGTGNGWKNIQSRLNQIGGEFFIDSKPGVSGTMVTINLGVEYAAIPSSPELEMTA